jgi:hypothetical protein
MEETMKRGKLGRQMRAFTRRCEDFNFWTKSSAEKGQTEAVAEANQRGLKAAEKDVAALRAKLVSAGVDVDGLMPKK